MDPILSRVYLYTVNGWSIEMSYPSFMSCSVWKAELSVEQGCVLWGVMVIVHSVLQEQMLTELHETHPGRTKKKAIARSFVWWPNMDSDIENMVSKCEVCQELRSYPAKADVHH